ncbi:MAG: methyltransferase domain-containing protein [Acidimicrobiales bacterium]
MDCRHCKTELHLVFVDLDSSPPSNAYLTDPSVAEAAYPLRVLVCDSCWLVQTEDYAAADELFSADYAYFSSYSESWLQHSERYVQAMIERLQLAEKSCVMEVAANDGYLLQYVLAAGIPCYGVEPTASTAKVAREKGIDIVEEFFGVELGRRLAAEGRAADLTAANNVLAHVPDINDFVGGFAEVLKPAGVSTFEFPHLGLLVSEGLFDTIYHEHYSYLSLTAVNRIFAENGLTVFDVEKITTHGGSLRVFAQRSDTGSRPIESTVADLLSEEAAAGVPTAAYYEGFQPRVDAIRHDLLEFLSTAAADGKSVAAYGAAAKGNTLLNYSGVGSEQVLFVVDANPHKQGQYLPGSHIPIVAESVLKEQRPDYVLVLPWNLMGEIAAQLSYIAEWDGKLVRAVPSLEIAEAT